MPSDEGLNQTQVLEGDAPPAADAANATGAVAASDVPEGTQPAQVSDGPQAGNASYGSFLKGNATARQTTEHTEPAPTLLDPGQDLMGSVLSTAAYLCLILGGIFLAYWLLRKFGPHGIARNKGAHNPKLVGRLMLGPKQHVDVVRIDRRSFVLGVTEHSINLLTELPAQPGQCFDDEDEDEFTDFAEMLGRKSGGDGDD